MSQESTRRDFVARTAAAAALLGAAPLRAAAAPSAAKPALLGGTPVRTAAFPSWPLVKANEEKTWSDVLHTGKWCRLDGSYANRFEETWANKLGAKYCKVTASGTTALLTSLNALDVGPGDEVIVPPYTFVATINAVLLPTRCRSSSTPTVRRSRSTRARSRRRITPNDDGASCRCTWAVPRPTWTRSCDRGHGTSCPCSRTPARRTWASGAAGS